MRRWQLHSGVLVSRRGRRVVRWGWGRKREGVQRNYSFLEHFADLVPIPRPLGKKRLGSGVVTYESLLDGTVRTARDFDYQAGCVAALAELKPVYERGWIHGDLTYRNMLFSETSVRLVDFDRSGPAAPEFDVWTLYYDWRTHVEGRASYATFMRLVLADLKNPVRLLEVAQPLYTMMPSLAHRQSRVLETGHAFASRVYHFFHEDIEARRLKTNLDEFKTALRI